MFKIPEAGKPEIGMTAGGKPLIKPACQRPVVESIVFSSMTLHPVMKKRDRRRMNDALGGKMAEEPAVADHDLFEFGKLPVVVRFIGVSEIFAVGRKGNGDGLGMAVQVRRRGKGQVLNPENGKSL